MARCFPSLPGPAALQRVLIGVYELNVNSRPPQRVKVSLDVAEQRKEVPAVVGPIVASGLGAPIDAREVLVQALVEHGEHVTPLRIVV